MIISPISEEIGKSAVSQHEIELQVKEQEITLAPDQLTDLQEEVKYLADEGPEEFLEFSSSLLLK